MYISLKEWIKKEFSEPRPTVKTVQKLCREGEVNGATKFGKKWYVKINNNDEVKYKEMKREQR